MLKADELQPWELLETPESLHQLAYSAKALASRASRDL